MYSEFLFLYFLIFGIKSSLYKHIAGQRSSYHTLEKREFFFRILLFYWNTQRSMSLSINEPPNPHHVLIVIINVKLFFFFTYTRNVQYDVVV